MLHLSDIHLDTEYVEGTLWDCDSYLCCREEFGYPTDPSKAAGYWGGYLCDLPVHTLQNMLEHIVSTHHIDSVFWTGDNSPHNTWSNTNEEVTNYTKLITQELKTAFKGTNVPIYPSTGNHDTWPVNNQDFSAPGINYPINHFVDDWLEWIGEEAAAEFALWGYCSIPFVLTSGKELTGSRVLIMNTQVANQGNFYLPGDKFDPANHLSWLEEQLVSIEAAGGIAYIAGHVQPFNFTEQFGARYQALMERYQHVVRFGLFGHTHD